MQNGPIEPSRGLTPTQWLICAIAAIGFAFDIYEILMLPLIVRPALADLLAVAPNSPEVNAWVGTLQYVPAVAGGIFGLLGETFRRRLAGLEGVDLPTRLRLVLRDFVRFQAAHPELHRFMIQEGIARSPRLEWLVETHIRPIYAFVRAMVEAAQREGMAPLGRPEHLHYMLIGAASSVYALAAEFELLTGEDPTDEALVSEHVATLERLYFPAPEARAARSR